MSSPIAIPHPSSRATSYASAMVSSTTTSGIMSSSSSSPPSAGVYVPVHKRLSVSPLTSDVTPLSRPLTYTPSFLLSLHPTAERFHEQIKSRIHASLEPEVADIVLMGRRMKKGSASRKKTKKADGVRQSTAAPFSFSLTPTSTTLTPTSLTQPLLSNTRPTSTSTSTKPKSAVSSNKTTLAPWHTRSSSTRARPLVKCFVLRGTHQGL